MTAGIVVFLVALPLCLGIALASGAPLFSGLLAGIIGGLLVGSLSGSSTSVSGPAAGLTAIVAAQIASLGSFEAFLFAVMVGGLIQIGLGIGGAGALSSFVPSSVIKGLLAAIGVILILKQIPHIVGQDSDPEGEMSFFQPDHETTVSEFGALLAGEVHLGAIVIGILSIALLIAWDRWKPLKESIFPGPLAVVLIGVLLNALFGVLGAPWVIEATHLVQIRVGESIGDFLTFFQHPDWAQWSNPAVYVAAVTIAVVASLETLLNMEAVDKLDPQQRVSPPNRELVAQGCGNVIAGLVGGLPMTSVIVRGSVNVNAGAATKRSAVFHGFLLLISVAVLPMYLNLIPLAALGAILLVTGFKLASPRLFVEMWDAGPYQFIPFIVTLVTIVLTDLLTGILVGLAVSVIFILQSNLRSPIRRIVETHIDGDLLHIELANQVSFLNHAALGKVLADAPSGSRVLIDASHTDYIDPDISSLIREFRDVQAKAHGVTVNLRGFKAKYELHDEVEFVDYSTRELQDRLTPQEVLKIMIEGNRRFRSGHTLARDFEGQIDATAKGQNPLVVALSCIDSRVPVEIVFDLGIGDAFSVRVAGNVLGSKTLGSVEYGVVVAGVRLVLVIGHTRCGAVTASVEMLCSGADPAEATGCKHLPSIVDEIEYCVDRDDCRRLDPRSPAASAAFIDEVAERNVKHTVAQIVERSPAIREAVDEGRAMVVGAMYDVATGEIRLIEP